ncbi:hypothetical protein [Streptomyces sp. JB150]|uniref:hypothetical protein n=1 Tax=Streptomyces sp. JB150 TaxID=2714844 RepID=UPI00140DE1C6|nr:hypothetical protein [Streptomyces sp. JB150]QIJ62590.1 hypothetical protein G7Z13_11485 [Streptomyces sp. JB150]
MTIPGWVRRWRTRFYDAQARKLSAQLAAEKDRNRLLEQRVADLQAANEGAYHALAIERGAACLKTPCSLCAAAVKDGAA